MPIEKRITETVVWAELNNGETFTFNELLDFSSSLNANTAERIRIRTKIEVGVDQVLQSWDWYNNSDGTAEVRKAGLDFTNDFAQGDTVLIWFENSGAYATVEGTVLSAKKGEIKLTKTGGSGTTVLSGKGFAGDDWISNTTPFTAMEFKYNVVANSSSFDLIDPYINAEQLFLVEDLETTLGQPAVEGSVKGLNKAGNVTTRIAVEYTANVFNLNIKAPQATWREYEISHDIILNSYWLEDEDDNLDLVDPPSRFSGAESMKYLFECGFFSDKNNVNTVKRVSNEAENEIGNIGYFGENFNGFLSNYSVSNLVYSNPDDPTEIYDKIQSSLRTKVEFSLNDDGSNFQSDDFFVVGHSKLPDSTEYSFDNEDYTNVWLYDSLRTRITSGSVSSDIIKDLDVTFVSSSVVDVSYILEYTPQQLARIEEGDKYALWIVSQNFNVSQPKVNNGGKATTKVDKNIYAKSADIEGLFGVSRLEHYPHPEDYTSYTESVGATNIKADVEEGLFTMCEFWLDTAKLAVLEDLFFKFIAYNPTTGTFFTLRSVLVDLSDSQLVEINNIINQRLSLDDTREFILKTDDQFNYLKLKTVDEVNNKRFYVLEIGWKVPWQEWLELTTADPIFYNTNQENNGLNNYSRNYSSQNATEEYGANPYELRVMIEANVSQEGISTNYKTRSEDVEIYGYDEDDQGLPATYTSCEIKTFDKDENELAQNILQGEETKVRAFFEPKDVPTFSESVDFTLVESTWTRAAHGSYSDLLPSFLTERITDWGKNNTPPTNQANDTDTYNGDTKASTSYITTTQSIQTTVNAQALYGLYSPEKYDFYSIDGKMFSTDPDDDAISYCIAFYVDGFGVEHTIHLAATTGGIGFGFNPLFVSGDPNTEIFDFRNAFFGTSNITPRWALIYNWGKEDSRIIDEYVTAAPLNLWWSDAQVEDLVFSVSRVGKDITAEVTWEIDSVTYNNVFNYDLTSNSDTQKFLGAQSIGFFFISQAFGGFKDVVLNVPSADNYGIIRAEPELSLNDAGIYEISTVREAPKNNLLIQQNGDEIKAEIAYIESTNQFILSAKVNQDQIVQGQKYKLSAEIGANNLITPTLRAVFAWVEDDDLDVLIIRFNTTPLIVDTTGLSLSFTSGTPRTITGVNSVVGNCILFDISADVDIEDVFSFDYDGTNTITGAIGALGADSINVEIR